MELCVFGRVCVWLCSWNDVSLHIQKSTVQRNRNALWYKSIDQSSICMLNGLALVRDCHDYNGLPNWSPALGYLGPLLVLLTNNVTLKLCFLCYLLIFLLNVAFQLDPTLTFWDNCKKNEIMQKWPISFINLFLWKLSCTINCVQFKIYIYIYILTWVKSTLSQQLYVIDIWREFPNILLLLLFLVCMGFLFSFCVVNWYLKKKKKEGEKKRLLFTDWKIIAFYTTEILS